MRRVQFVQQGHENMETQPVSSPPCHNLVPPSTPEQSNLQRNSRRANVVAQPADRSFLGVLHLQHTVLNRDMSSMDPLVQQHVLSIDHAGSDQCSKTQLIKDVSNKQSHHTFIQDGLQKSSLKTRLDAVSLSKLPRTTIASKDVNPAVCNQGLISSRPPVYSLSPQLLKPVSKQSSSTAVDRPNLNSVTSLSILSSFMQQPKFSEAPSLHVLSRDPGNMIPCYCSSIDLPCPDVSRTESVGDFGLKFIPPGCELALQVYATVCSILEEQDQIKHSYQSEYHSAFPKHMLNYAPAPHICFSVYNLRLCDSTSSISHPKTSSWTEAEQIEDMIYRVTITESGVIFKTPSKQFTHFISLEQFKTDIKAFVLVRALNLFGNFRLVKSMQLWKREARSQVFNRHLEAVGQSLRWHSQSLVSCIQFTQACIFNVQRNIEHAKIWNLDMNLSANAGLQNIFAGNELEHCDTLIQAFISCCKNWFKDMVEDIASCVKSSSCNYLSNVHYPHAQFKLASTLDMVRAIRHEDLMKRLLPFVKVCSYMIESAKLQFCFTSSQMMFSNFLSPSQPGVQTSLFFVKFLSEDDKLHCDSQTFIMQPSRESVCKWFELRHSDLINCFQGPLILTSREDVVNLFMKQTVESAQARRSWFSSSDCVSHDFRLLMNQQCSENLNRTLEIIANGLNGFESMKLSMIETPLECRAFLASIDLSVIRNMFMSLFTESRESFLDMILRFKNLISRMFSCQKSIHGCFVDCSLISIGWCTLNMVNFLRQLDEYASARISDAESCICDCFQSIMFHSEEQLAQFNKEFSYRDTNPASFAMITLSLSNAPDRCFNLEESLRRLENLLSVAFSCGLNLPDLTPVLKHQFVLMEAIRLGIENCSEWQSVQFKSAVKHLADEHKSILLAVERLQLNLASSNASISVPTGSQSDFENVMASLDFFESICSVLVVRGNDLQSHRSAILSDCDLRDLSQPNILISNLISDYKLIWSSAYEANQFWARNVCTPIAAISIDAFSEEYAKFQRINSRCQESREIASLPVFKSFTLVLQNIHTVILLAHKFQSKTLNDSHWNLISRIVAGAYSQIWSSNSSATEGLDRLSTESDSMDIQRGVALTLNECINWELGNGYVFQQISQVVMEAQVQNKLESSLQEQTLLWTVMSFQFEVRESNLLFSSLDMILELVNESLSPLLSILSSKFCSLFADECQSLSINLSRIRALVEIWSNLQDLCCQMENIYSSNEFRSMRGFPIFEREKRRWMSCVEVVANRPSVFYACGLYDLSGEALEDTDLYDIKREYAMSLQEGFLAARQEAVAYLDSKRLIWPRLFAVPTETLMLAVSQPIPSRNSCWPQLFLSVFQSVEMVTTHRLDVSGDSGSSSVTLSDRTKLSLDIALNFSEKIELWLLSLHEAIASRMLESVKTFLLDFGFKDSSESAFTDAPLPPAKGRSQIIAICDWAIWCRRISLALVDSVLPSTGFGEKVSRASLAHNITFSSGRQRSTIKNLEAVCASANLEVESCSFNITQPTAMMHHILLQLQRMMLCAWVRDLLGDMISSSGHAVIDSHCWAWSSIIRYHVDNCESEFLSVRICDEVTCFGYEVIAQAAGHSTFPIVCMTDRMRLICSLAVSASACIPSSIDGPCASGKSSTINFLASLYGRFVATLPCCASLQNSAVDMFLDLALHSSSVSTVCCIKDMDSLAPNVLSHLSSSLRRINDIISDRVRTRNGASSHQFWFLCCTTCGLNMGKNISYVASSFSRTIRIIDVDRVALIACVLKGFGFSLAQNLSQKLHVFCQQLSTLIQSPALAAHVSSAAVVFNVLHFIITTWNVSRSDRDVSQRSGHHQSSDFGTSKREVECVVQSLCKVFQPLLSTLSDSLNFGKIVSACFGIHISEPFFVATSSNSFPSSFDQYQVFFHTLGIDCSHHLETAINLWNCTTNSVLPSPFVIIVGSDGSGRNFTLALFEMLSIHFSQMTFKTFSICSSHELTGKLLQRILEQVDRSFAISHFDVTISESNDFEIDLCRSSKPLSSETSTWLILYLQSSVLAQSFGNGRIPNLLDKIKSSAKCVTIESGVTIIQRHSHNKYIYIIVTGNVSLICNGKLWSVGSGHMFGDFTAINGVKSICAAVSASKSTLIVVPSQVFCGNLAEVDREVSTISKTSHCLIVADAVKSALFIDSLAVNSDYLSYTTWGADSCSWHRNLKMSTSIVIKCNDIHHDAPTTLSRCGIVVSPLLNGDSQVSLALNWLRHHSFAAVVGSIVFDLIASLFHNHVSCCLNFFMKLENRTGTFTTFAKTAAQLLVCVCASCVPQQGTYPTLGSLKMCTCDAERLNRKSNDFISIWCSRKLPSIEKTLNSSIDSVAKCQFCSFKLSPSLRSFVGDLDTNSAEFSSIKMFWANMVAFCVLHSVRGLLPYDFATTNLFEKHAKNGFVDVVFRSSSVFDWCISTKVPYMTSLGNCDLHISQNLEAMFWRSGLSNCNLMQELFIPTNYTRNACWLAQCWLHGGFSSVIFDGHRSCGKSALAQYVAESFVSDSKSVYRPLTQRSAQSLFQHPLEYFSTRRVRNVELSPHLQAINVHSVQHSQCVFFIDDVHVMPLHCLMGIRSLQQLGCFWFLSSNRNGVSSVLNVINIPSIIVMTTNSAFDRIAAIGNFALNINCSDFSNADNLKSIYSVLAQVSLQSTCIPASDRFELIDQIGTACSSLHLLLNGMKLKSPSSRLIAQGLQGILECGDFLKSKDETARLFCHEMLHSVFDGTNVPLIDSDYASYLRPQLKSSSALTFQNFFRTISSCFPQADLKEMDFLKTARIFEAHSVEIVLSAASRKCAYTAQNAINAISILQDSASQLLSDDDSLRNFHQIDFLHSNSDFSDLDDSARNCYGFTEDTTNILRFVRALRCKGSHIVVTNSSFLKAHVIPLAVFHCGLEMIALSSKPSLHYDRSDAISDLRQIFESAVFSATECVVVLSHLHLNDNTCDVFLSAIHWVDTIGHACFDEKWMLEQSRRFVNSGVFGYTSDETIKLMRTRFISNFHAIICCSEDDTCNVIKPLTQLNSVFRICLMHSVPTQNQVVTTAFVTSWLQQFRWDHWSNGLSLRNLYNSHSSRVIRDHRDSLHPGLSSRVVSLLSSLNIGYEQVLSVFLSPSMSDLKIQSDRALESLQCSVHFLQWFFQVNSDVGVCPDYIPFSFPKDISSFCISIFTICASTILRSSSAHAIKFSMFPLSIYVSQVIHSLEKQVMLCFNRLLQLEAAIQFSFECALIISALTPALEAAQIQHQIAAFNLSNFEDELSAESDCGNDSSSSSVDNNQHALLLVSAEQSAKQIQQLSSMMTFCECHSHISIEEMSSEAFALTSSIVRIVPDAALQQALLMVGSVIEEEKLQDLLQAVIPIASAFDEKIRLSCKIDLAKLPSYNFEFIQLLPFHALVKYSLSWTFDFTQLVSACAVDQVSSTCSGGTLPPIFSLASHVSIKNVSAFIRVSSVVNHLGSGPNALPILVLDPKRIFQQAFISLFSIEDVCITSVDEGHNPLAFARAVLTAVRGGLCLIVQGFSCCPSIGFPKLLLNLINRNFSSEGSEDHFLKLDPDTKSMANVLGIPSSRDVPIHPNFCLLLVCNGNDCLSPHHSSIFKVIAMDVSHHVLSGIISNCILQQQKHAFDNHFSSIKSICSNLQLLKQGWESIILDSAQASGNFSYGAFAFKAVSEDSVDDGWRYAIDTCLRDPHAILNQESLRSRLQHKLQQNQITMALKEFCIVLKQIGILHYISSNIAQTLVYSLKACSPASNFINLLACFDRIISSVQTFHGNCTKKTKTSLEKGHSHDHFASSGQVVNFDDELTTADVQDDRISKFFSDTHWDRSLLDAIEIDIHIFIAASLSESQRLSFSLFCAWHRAKAAGHVSDDEWLVLTCSDEHLEKAWASTTDSMQDESVHTSACVVSQDQKLFLQALACIKNKLQRPSIRSWLEALISTSHAAKECKRWQTYSNLLPSDSSLHGLCLVAARVYAPHLHSFCVQEFLKIYSAHLKLKVPVCSMNQNQLLVACKNAQATIICTSLPHSCIKSSLVQLCPDCRSLATSRDCVHFLIFDCKHFEGVEQSSVVLGDDNFSNEQSAPEVAAMPGFPIGRLHSALVCAISDAVASGKGLIVLHATSFVSYWQGYLRHASIASNSSNSNQLSQLVLVCDSNTSAGSIQAVSAWSRIVFWNFPLTCELSDSYGAGILWLSRNLRQQVLDSRKFKVAILSQGFRAVSFQERLFLRITSCLFSFALAIHTRSCIQYGFFTGQQMFDVQLFFNHAVSVAISWMQCSGSCDTKTAFLSYGFPWLRHQVIFGCGLQLATKRDITLIMSIFDSLISPDIVSDEFTPPFLESGVFPSLNSANDMDSLVSSIAESKNHAVDSLRSISLLKLPEWYSLQYSWMQELLCNCFIQNCEQHRVCISPQLLLSKAEVMQLLQYVHGALPPAEVYSSLLDATHQQEHGVISHQILFAAVSEATIFIAALKQTRALVHELLENLSRRCALCVHEEADVHALRRNNAPERWRKFFGFATVMRVSEFITSANQFASFWSSWPERKLTGATPVVHANCFKNFGRVLQLLALSKTKNSDCKLTDIKCVVLPMADRSIGVQFCIQVQGLIGRGFGWNGRVAEPTSDMQTNFEESSTKLQRQNAPFEMFKRTKLVPLGEVSIVAMSSQELQDCFPSSTATLHSMPILHDGFDSHEVDSAPLISFFFNKPTSNFMCVLH